MDLMRPFWMLSAMYLNARAYRDTLETSGFTFRLQDELPHIAKLQCSCVKQRQMGQGENYFSGI